MRHSLDDARRRFLQATALSIGGIALSGCGGGGQGEAAPGVTNNAPPPSPPTAASLKSAVDALTAGQWGAWTVSNVLDPDPGNSGDTIFSYAQRATWDSARRVIQFWGGVHGSGGMNTMWLATYAESNNAWSKPIPAGGDPSFEHGYYNATINQATGEVYTRLAFGDTTTIRVFNQSMRQFTSSFASPPVVPNYSNPMEWHPTLNGGSLVCGGVAGIYRRTASAWARLGPPGDGSIGDQGPVCAYNHMDGCVYMGGGNGTGANNLWRVQADGSITSCASPFGWTLATWDASSDANTAMLLGGSPDTRMVAISKGLSIREYDHATNTWSDVIATVPSAVDAGPVDGANWIACSVPDYNCIVFFKLASMTSVSTTAHVWKR